MLLLGAARLVEVHEDSHERRLAIRSHEGHDLVLDGLHATAYLLEQAVLDDLGDLLARGVNAELGQLARHLAANLLAADLHEGREVRE